MKTEYRQWHEALSVEFFGTEHVLRSTVLYVDDEVERKLLEDSGIGRSLASAVGAELDWSMHGTPLLGRIQHECDSWLSKGSTGPPPSLPVLALSVLAATRMESSGGMLRSNFYGRWARLFGEGSDSYRGSRLASAFPDVAQMWEQLNTWLDDTCGLYGTSTVSTDDRYWKIGYPISQALIRGADRQILTRFFAATRLRPRNSDEISGRELLRRLCVWTAGRDRHLSPRLMDELADAAGFSESLITSLLRRLADDWDGTLHEPERETRRRALGLRLVVADGGRRLEWLAEAVDSLTETEVGLPGGRAFALSKEYGDVYGGLESLRPSPQQLAHGLRLEGEALVLEWAPQEIVLLKMHPYLGEWVSTEYFEPGEQHWILAAESAVSEVRTMLDRLGSRSVREAAAPIQGWKLFKGVRAINGSAFARTLDRGGPQTRILEPQIRQDAVLSGGLRIAPEYQVGAGVAGHFLRGGAPDLLLPASDSPDGSVEVILDGRSEKLRADPRVPFPLCDIPLEDGKHRVGTPGSGQIFTLHDGLHERQPPGTGTLGFVIEGTALHGLGPVDGSDSAIRGAAAPPSIRLPRTVLVRRVVLEALLLDACGGAHRVKFHQPPAWMTSRLPEDALGPCLEAEVLESHVWLVYRTATRWSVRQLVVEAEIPDPAPSSDDYVWAHALLSAASRLDTAAWLDYVAAAEAVVGKRGA